LNDKNAIVAASIILGIIFIHTLRPIKLAANKRDRKLEKELGNEENRKHNSNLTQ